MRFPFVISLPHCSSRVPQEIRPFLSLSPEEIIESTDLGTAELFGPLPAEAVVRAEWSRLVADLNRSPRRRDDRGVIAQVDYFGRMVHLPTYDPTEEEIRSRLYRYYYPFHRRLREAVGGNGGFRILLDCHSLCKTGPPQAPDAGKKRKDIILGNNGNARGEAKTLQGLTCPRPILEIMKRALERSGFTVSINTPYSGGFITRHYGGELCRNGEGGAVQIEINQQLFMAPHDLRIVPDRLSEVRERIYRSLWETAKSL